MIYYRAKAYIDCRNFSIVKDGLYTIKELQNLGYLSSPHHPTAHSTPPIDMFDKVNVKPTDCYYFFGVRFHDELEVYLNENP